MYGLFERPEEEIVVISFEVPFPNVHKLRKTRRIVVRISSTPLETC
jgi:hypothetical protein